MALRVSDDHIDRDQWGMADDASKVAIAERVPCSHATMVTQAYPDFNFSTVAETTARPDVSNRSTKKPERSREQKRRWLRGQKWWPGSEGASTASSVAAAKASVLGRVGFGIIADNPVYGRSVKRLAL